jgi:hypothetical protein
MAVITNDVLRGFLASHPEAAVQLIPGARSAAAT